MPRTGKFIDTGGSLEIPRGWEERGTGFLFKRCGFLVWEGDKVLEMGRRDGCAVV